MNDKPGTLLLRVIDADGYEYVEYDNIDIREYGVYCYNVDRDVSPVEYTQRTIIPWSRILEIQRPSNPTDSKEVRVASDGGEIL